MLQITNLTLRRGTKELLRGANLSVHDGQKIGIVGANGTGKSSLFALIRGELETDTGSVRLPKDWRVAWMALSASGRIFTNHWSDKYGSITVLQR